MLIRLLARLTDLKVSAPKASRSDPLSQWLGWTDAIALSGVLNSAPPTVVPCPPGARDTFTHDYAQLRAALEQAIAQAGAPTRRPGLPGRAPAPLRGAAPLRPPTDFATYRQRYLTVQRTMETRIAALRQRLRAAVAGVSPGLAQLARVDAALAQAMDEREQYLLGTIPGLLARHFEQLQRAEADAPDPAPPPADPAGAPAWLNTFQHDMRQVLLAELDIRLQPVQGLLAALAPSGHHEQPIAS